MYVADVAPLISAKLPDSEPALDHCHTADDTAPSGSAKLAVSTAPTCATPETVTAPGSFSFATLIVSVTMSSNAGDGSPAASSPSLTRYSTL